MKRIIPILALVLLLAGAFFFLQHRQAAARVRGVTLAPPETLFFAQLPDLRRTAERWPGTSLNQLLREPEMQAFLEKPRSKLPWMAETQVRMDQLAQALPREAFVALTSIDGNNPTFVAGLCFDGHRTALEELLADVRQSVRSARPAGKADIVAYAGTEIETYTDKDVVIAETFRDNWYFISNSLELLQSTINRYDGKAEAGGRFGDNESYLKAMAQLPNDADVVLYGNVRVLTDRVTTLLQSAGQKPDAGQLAALQSAEAIAATVKLDGTLMRDTIFVLAPQTGKATPLARRSLALTTPDTLLYYAGAMATNADLASTTAPLAALIPALAGIEQALAAEGLKIGDFTEIFGPESSGILDWPLVDAQPTFMLSLDVRDAERAQKFVQAATGASEVQAAWGRREENGATLFVGPGTGMMNLTPVVGLSREFLVLGFSPETVLNGLNRPEATGSHVDKSERYGRAVKMVSTPTSAFAYLDTRTLFERIYGIVRPFVAMSMAFSPDAGQYFDAGKLPTTEVIVRHLGPSTFSQTQVENGLLIESAGTLTLNQTLLGAGVAIGAAAMPMLQQLNAPGGPAGGLLPPGLLPPQSTPAVPPPQVPATPPQAAPSPAPEPPVEA